VAQPTPPVRPLDLSSIARSGAWAYSVSVLVRGQVEEFSG